MDLVIAGHTPADAIAKLMPWARKGGVAVLDQALFAGAHFIVNILLARWLEPAQYGAFALAYSVFLLLASFHTAILTEPMMVFGAGKYREQFQKYVGMLLYGHFGLMAPIALVLLAAAFIAGHLYSSDVMGGLFGLAAAGPFILLLWMVRRGFYVRLEPGRAAAGGALYLALLLGIVYGFHVGGRLSQATAFLSMGVGALIVSILFIKLLHPQLSLAQGNPTRQMVVGDHWRYGRWALATAGIMWLPGNIYYVILPAWVGLEGVGALTALMNLAMPALHTMGAVSSLIIPLLGRRLKEGGVTALGNPMKAFLYAFLAGAGLYLAVLVLFKVQLLHLLYGDKYVGYASLVPLVGILPLGASVVTVLGGALRAMERPDSVFWCYVASSIVALLALFLLGSRFGLTGAVLALLLSSLSTGMVMSLFFTRSVRHSGEA